MREDRIATPSRHVIGKRLLTIESYVAQYYDCDIRAVGKLTKKFIHAEQLGLVIVTYNTLFGRHTAPTPYHLYAMILERERTSALSWEKKAYGYLEVYKNKKRMYDEFLESHRADIMNDCATNLRLDTNMYVKIVSKLDLEKIEGDRFVAATSTT